MHHIVAAYPGRSSGREPDHAGSHVALACIRRQRICMAATLPYLAGLRCCGAVAATRRETWRRSRWCGLYPGGVSLQSGSPLGANRMQLVRQMVLEGVVLSMVAGGRGPRVDNVDIEEHSHGSFRGELLSPDFTLEPGQHGPQRGDRDYGVFPVGRACSAARCPPGVRPTRPAVEVLKAESASISGGSRQPEIAQRAGGGANRAFTSSAGVLNALFLRTLRNLAGANPGFEQDHHSHCDRGTEYRRLQQR